MNASPSARRDCAPPDTVRHQPDPGRGEVASKARAARVSAALGVGAALLLAGLAGCGGGGTDGAAPAPTVPSLPAPSPSPAPPPPVATAPELPPPQDRWNLETGGNPADELERYTFEDVTLGLNDFSLTVPRPTDRVQREGDTLTVLRDGQPVLTVVRDALGITASVPDTPGARVGLALRGELNGTLTVFSQRPLRLTLAGTTLASGNGPALNLQHDHRTFLLLAEGTDNRLSDGETYAPRRRPDGSAMDLKAALFSEGPLIVSGAGRLQVRSARHHAIASDAHLRIRSGRIELRAEARDGVRALDAVVIDDGDLQIRTPAGKGIKVDGRERNDQPLGFFMMRTGRLDVVSHDKAVTASWEGDEDGVTPSAADDPDARLLIHGGTIDITTTGTPSDRLSPEGLEAKSTLAIHGGAITLRTTDDAMNAGRALLITGGRIFAESSANDALDSNGTLTIAGGVVVARSVAPMESGIDCDSGLFSLTGGTLLAIGHRNSVPTTVVTTQNVVLLRALTEGRWTLRDDAGAARYAFTLPGAARTVLLSSPRLTTGSTLTLVGGGELGPFAEDFGGLILEPTTHSGGTATLLRFRISGPVTQP
jgi:hypothetical protein